MIPSIARPALRSIPSYRVAMVGALVMTGCPTREESDTFCECRACDCEPPPPPEPEFDWVWDAQGLTVTITNVQSTGFDLGLAETADPVNGWFGEDCLNGTMTQQRCHALNGSMTGALDSVHEEIQAGGGLDLIVLGETTYFDQSFADRLTYEVTVDDGSCWVFGHDPSYYTSSTKFASCSVVP